MIKEPLPTFNIGIELKSNITPDIVNPFKLIHQHMSHLPNLWYWFWSQTSDDRQYISTNVIHRNSLGQFFKLNETWTETNLAYQIIYLSFNLTYMSRNLFHLWLIHDVILLCVRCVPQRDWRLVLRYKTGIQRLRHRTEKILITKGKTTCATWGAKHVYPSVSPEFTPVFSGLVLLDL